MPSDPQSEDRVSEAGSTSRRILFLDDDAARAATFLERVPEAVWVETVSACLEKLAESWDEVHLDHDLGGEIFVEVARDDCGMEVVRRLCLEPYPHLKSAKFVVHSHNHLAATVMVLNLSAAGYAAVLRPFGLDAELALDHADDDLDATDGPDADGPTDDPPTPDRRRRRWFGGGR